MKSTKLLLGVKAQEKILAGVNRVYEPLKLALGPNSARALMYNTWNRGPRMTEDGYTIAGVIDPEDEFEKLVKDAFEEAVKRTNEEVGDGTTSTAVVAGALINGGFNLFSGRELAIRVEGSHETPKKARRKMLELSKVVQEKVRARAKKVETKEELNQIALISTGDEKVAKLVSDVVWEVGTDGFVDVVEGFKGEIETEIIKGARFPAKPADRAFLNNKKKFQMVAEQCAVAITDYKIDNEAQARAYFEGMLRNNKKVVVIAPNFSTKVLQMIYQTVFKPVKQGDAIVLQPTGIDIYPIKAPSLRTEQWEDLSVYFGANFISEKSGRKLESIKDEDLGFAEKVVTTDTEAREDAIAVGGRGSQRRKVQINNSEMEATSPLEERIETLKAQVDEERQQSFKNLLRRRIASLGAGVAVIRVGASTQAESLPMKLKVEDAQYACKAALQDGYVRGGGLCLKDIADELEKERQDAPAFFLEALRAPYEQIQTNNEEPFEIPEDVIDPTKVVCQIVENAVEVAANLLTVKILIPEVDEKPPYEGYKAIAKELAIYNMLFARKEGIQRENLEEMQADHERAAFQHRDELL